MKIYRIFSILVAAACTMSLASCSDDDDNKVSVQESNVANVRETASAFDTLTFGWDRVDGVNQYGYTLLDADGLQVDHGVTTALSVTFADLKAASKYSFELSVYGATGETSYHTIIEASTLPIVQLEAPSGTCTQEGNRVNFSWTPVDGAYAYKATWNLGENEYSEVTDGTSVTITGLAPGTHTLGVQALSNYGGYTDSEVTRVQAVRTRTEVKSVQGTYTCSLIRRNNSWDCTMHFYDDNTYVIDAFYQGENYNLDFYVDVDPETGENYIGIYNFLSYPDSEYYVVETGRSSVPQIDLLCGPTAGSEGSSFTVNGDNGEMTVSVRNKTTTGTDKFVW